MDGPDQRCVRTYPLDSRPSKVKAEDFGKPVRRGQSMGSFLRSLPRFLGARDLMELAHRVVKARRQGHQVMLAFGGHVIKVGLSLIVIDLIKEGWISSLATNGAGMIHDFELAMAGKTSEDVDEAINDGSFGMAEEIGRILNRVINEGVHKGEGLGEAVGKALSSMDPPYASHSVLAASWRLGTPTTVHVAIGTDINHLHPTANGGALGEGSYRDFRLFCERVRSLDGGVFINVGSAVVLPEVFLKAVSLARNTGSPLKEITTANMDFIQHYRPINNVVRRPTMRGGRGIALTGHHEIMLPLLAAAIKEAASSEGVGSISDNGP